VGRNTFRAKILKQFGASAREVEEVLAYNKSDFDHSRLHSPLQLPLPDEASVATWQRYAAEAGAGYLFDYLKQRLVQLQFPIRKGIRATEDYRRATLMGIRPREMPEAAGLQLQRPEALTLSIHPSLAGRVPILNTGAREDFVAIAQALSAHNEPEPVPPSMGALTVKGYNNWDRISVLKKKWEREHPDDFLDLGWAEAFRRIIPQKEFYQDFFIIISDGPYSNVQAESLGMSEIKWKELSLVIRREHECTHYFTRRLFGSMENRLLDEIMADFMGILEATGIFRVDWFLRFMGLENYPEYREGGRLQNYLVDSSLSENAVKILQGLAVSAARNLGDFFSRIGDRASTLEGKSLVLISLAYFTVEEMASGNGALLMRDAYENVIKSYSQGIAFPKKIRYAH